MPRLSYEDSLTELKRRAIIGANDHFELPATIPSPLDDGHGLSFFRTLVEGDLSSLCIPRTLFCRSEVRDCRFVDTDLHESFLCWNDFTKVDFSSAVLRHADLRGSTFTTVRFQGADLTGADLRRTGFDACDFNGAIMVGAKVSRVCSNGLVLSPEQKEQVEWSLLAGDEPPGG